MALAGLVWLCTLPITFLLIGPWLGLKVAGAAALTILGVIVAICWTACSDCETHPLPGGSDTPIN